jgi:hypothetical protein
MKLKFKSYVFQSDAVTAVVEMRPQNGRAGTFHILPHGSI